MPRCWWLVAHAVEGELRASAIPIPTRTVWNGIDFGPLQSTPELRQAAGEFRRRLKIADDALVLLALANPRPQKRMEVLPAVLAATRAEFRRLGSHREVKLLIAGEPSQVDPSARAAEAALHAAVAEHGLSGTSISSARSKTCRRLGGRQRPCFHQRA